MIGNQENTAEQDSSTVTSLEIGVQIKQFVLERFPAFVGTSLDATTPLLEDGEIDSLGAIELVNLLKDRYLDFAKLGISLFSSSHLSF